MNYQITEQWQSLSTIMGEDYSATAEYRIHNNIESPNHLLISEESGVTANDKGRIIPTLSEIYNAKGLDLMLRGELAKGHSANELDIEISVVTE